MMRRLMLILVLTFVAFPTLAQDDAPPLDPATLTATELIRLPLFSAPAGTSALLAPNGEQLMHVQNVTFCLYALLGVPLKCTDMAERLGEIGERMKIDSENIIWSPDGRFIAFTSPALMFMRDADVWVLEVETGLFANMTDDRHEGRVFFGDNIPDTAKVDLALAWMPDGRLSFARHSATPGDVQQPELWAVTPMSGTPEKIADLVPGSEVRNFVTSMDWSADGRTLTYIVDSRDNPLNGVWLYDAETGSTRSLLVRAEETTFFSVVTFSPDDKYILLLDSRREDARSKRSLDRGTGYTVIPVDGSDPMPVIADLYITSAGWLPDGGLIYTGWSLTEFAGGLYVTAVPDEAGRILMEYPMSEEGGDPLPIFGPTSRQSAPLVVHPNGRLLLATPTELTLVMALSGE